MKVGVTVVIQGFDILMCLYKDLQEGVQVGCKLPHWRYTIAFNVTFEILFFTLSYLRTWVFC
jgi:hypothetical protein